VLLVLLALCIVLITLDFRQGEGGPLEKAREISAAVVAPIQRGFTTVFRPVGEFIGSLDDLGELRSENQKLEEQLDELESAEARYRAILEENREISALLNIDASWAAMESATAQVTSRVPANYKWAYTIDKGTSSGIERNMAVIDEDGLVGKIVQVSSHQSTVLLLIDPDAAAGARIQGVRDTGAVEGRGASEHLKMSLIGGDARVNVDNIVVTSGLDGGIFPPGIPIGEVVEVGGEGSELEQEIKVTPFVDFTALDYVQVLLESGPNLEEDGSGQRQVAKQAEEDED
jgi:rod shape-determining protein MreC